MRAHLALAALVVLILASCGQSPASSVIVDPTDTRQAQTTAVPTQTAVTTATPAPTARALATATLTRLPLSTQTTAPSQTPSPVPTPTATPLPIPPLITHTWDAGPVLLSYNVFGGDGGPWFNSYLNSLPALIVYSDGRAFATHCTGEYCDVELRQTRMSRRGMCRLLYSVEQTGFFDYDPSTYAAYETQFMDGGDSLAIRAAYDKHALLRRQPARLI